MICSKHGIEKTTRRRKDGRARHLCLRCEADRLQRHRATGRQPEDPVKKAARKAVEIALRHGDIRRKPCVRCGAVAQAHHEDYSKPLDVTWLCPKDHKARHREMLCEAA